MKISLLFACLLFAAFSCNGISGSPKDSLSKFLTAMQNSNYEEAKKYATDDSQSFLDMLNKNGRPSDNVYNGKTFEIMNAETTGNDAKVEVRFSSSTPVYFHLKSEHSEWKVKFNLNSLMEMVKDLIKKEGIDIDKEVNKAIDSIKINVDSLP